MPLFISARLRASHVEAALFHLIGYILVRYIFAALGYMRWLRRRYYRSVATSKLTSRRIGRRFCLHAVFRFEEMAADRLF